jgi:hypothetical protein
MISAIDSHTFWFAEQMEGSKPEAMKLTGRISEISPELEGGGSPKMWENLATAKYILLYVRDLIRFSANQPQKSKSLFDRECSAKQKVSYRIDALDLAQKPSEKKQVDQYPWESYESLEALDLWKTQKDSSYFVDRFVCCLKEIRKLPILDWLITAAHIGFGNCGEMGMHAYLYGLRHGMEMELCELVGNDHTFAVVGSLQDKTSAVICDPWGGFCFPLSQTSLLEAGGFSTMDNKISRKEKTPLEIEEYLETIEQCVQTNYLTPVEYTFLHSCIEGDADMVQQLMTVSRRREISERTHKVGFINACRNGHSGVLQALLSVKVAQQVFKNEFLLACQSNQAEVVGVLMGHNSEFLGAGFIDACLRGRIDVLKKMLSFSEFKHLPKPILLKGLREACCYKNSKMLRLLVEDSRGYFRGFSEEQWKGCSKVARSGYGSESASKYINEQRELLMS